MPSTDDDDEGEGTKMPNTYSALQLLMMEVQDKTYTYLVVHMEKLLAPSVYVWVREEELRYEANADGLLTNTARNRMPWGHYKEVVLKKLPKGSGWHYLKSLVQMHRLNTEARRRWLQRISIGRKWSAEYDISLPDAIYVGLALRYFGPRETIQMAEAYMRGLSDGEGEDVNADFAATKLAEQKWEVLKELSDKCVEAGDKYRLGNRHLKDPDRMYTLEEARQLLAPSKDKAGNKVAKRANGNRKKDLICNRCANAGLTGRHIKHDPDQCNPSQRRAKLRKMGLLGDSRSKSEADPRKKTGRKRAREYFSQGDKPECPDCKANGRKYTHKASECNFAPGGPWHGLQGEKLKIAQRQMYNSLREAKEKQNNGGKTRTKYRSRVIKKPKLERNLTCDDVELPYWRSRSLMAVKHPINLRKNMPETVKEATQQVTLTASRLHGPMRSASELTQWVDDEVEEESSAELSPRSPIISAYSQAETASWAENQPGSHDERDETPGWESGPEASQSELEGSNEAILLDLGNSLSVPVSAAVLATCQVKSETNGTSAEKEKHERTIVNPDMAKAQKKSDSENASTQSSEVSDHALFGSEESSSETEEDETLHAEVAAFLGDSKSKNPTKRYSETVLSRDDKFEYVIVISESDTEEEEEPAEKAKDLTCLMMRKESNSREAASASIPEEDTSAMITVPVQLVACGPRGHRLHCVPFEYLLLTNHRTTTMFEAAETAFPVNPGAYRITWVTRASPHGGADPQKEFNAVSTPTSSQP